jgi:hypothetical protein
MVTCYVAHKHEVGALLLLFPFVYKGYWCLMAVYGYKRYCRVLGIKIEAEMRYNLRENEE